MRRSRCGEARTFYTEFTSFTSMIFARYAAEGVLNLAEVTEWIKKAMQDGP